MLDIRLLGAFAVHVDGTDVPGDAWRLRKARALVKLLALAPSHRMHREQVVELLWPGKEDARALNNSLHQAVYAARRALEAAGADGAKVLALREDVLGLHGDVTVDALQLERAIAAARTDGRAAAYETALAGAGAELLPEDRYEDWTTDRRDSLRELVIAAYLELAALQELPDDAVEVLQRALALDPLHEGATRLLMRAYADAGRRQRALEAFEHLRSALNETYAADPDEETRRLYRELLTASESDGSRGAPSAIAR